MNAQPPLAWRDMNEEERSVWTCAFATGSAPEAEDRGRYADAAVYLLRCLPDRQASSVRPPESQAAYANATIERHEFNIWYRIAMQIQFGNRWDYHKPTDQECANAWEQYQMGLQAYY
jgi:hypothetical protein